MHKFIILLLLLSFNCFADFEQGTNERNNLDHILTMLDETPSPEAALIAWRIRDILPENRNDIGLHDTHDYVGLENALGRTFRWYETTIRSDVAVANKALQMQTDIKDFAKGLNFLNTIIHEIYHYEDYMDSEGRGASPEIDTYPRGHLLFYSIIKYNYFINFMNQLRTNGPRLSYYRERLVKMVKFASTDIGNYDVHAHGNYRQLFKPLYEGNNCFRELTRAEVSTYLLHVMGVFRDTTLTLAQVEEKLSHIQNYFYPGNIGEQCSQQTDISERESGHGPVGYFGPRVHQRMFRMRVAGDDHQIYLEKTSEFKEFRIDIMKPKTEVDGIIPLKLQNSMRSYHEVLDTHAFSMGDKILIVEAPMYQNISFNGYGYYYDRDGVQRRYDLQITEITAENQARYGYHPINYEALYLLFDFESVSALNNDLRYEVIEFNGKKDDYLRISIPAVDRRKAHLYRLTGEVDANGAPKKVFVSILYDFYPMLDVTLPEDGEYLLFVERDSDRLSFANIIPVSFELSRNGAISSMEAKPKIVSDHKLSILGYFTPRLIEQSFNLSVDDATGYHGPYIWQKMFDLKTKAGDIIHYKDVNLNQERVAFLVKEQNNELTQLDILYDFHDSARWVIQDDSPHYLIVANKGVRLRSRGLSFTLKKYREGTPPSPIMQLDSQDAFGFYPLKNVISKVDFDETTNRGLIYNTQYRLIKFNMPASGIVNFYNQSSFMGRRFVLFKIDEADFAANRASLVDIHRSYSWYNQFEKEITAGEYILAIESEEREIKTGEAHYRIMFSLENGADPELINVHAISDELAREPRFRLKN